MDLALSGLASGFDWKSVVDQLTELDRAPQKRLKAEQLKLGERKNAVSSLITELTNLRTKTDSLRSSDFFQGSGTAASTDDTVAKASAGAGSAAGTFKFKIYQLATASYMTGGAGNGSAGLTGSVSDTAAMNSSSAGFGVPVTTGTFSLAVKKSDGSMVTKQFTVDSTTTLSGILTSIADDADLELDASYNSATDKVTIGNQSGGTVTEVILGAPNDTSNFFDAARLRPNGSNSITSSNPLGGANLSSTLSSINFSNTGDALADGSFTVNGVSISYKTSDTLSTVLSAINGSSAGVSAYYDTVQDRIILTNKSTGATGIALEDTSGNLLKKLNLVSSANNGNAGGTLIAGNDLFYTINDGNLLRSKSNIITSESSGLNGISVTALKAGKGVQKVSSFNDGGDDSPPNSDPDSVTTKSAHGISTGDAVTFLGTDVPSAIGTKNTYYARPDSSDSTKFTLHKTQQGAFRGNTSDQEDDEFYELTATTTPSDSWVAIGSPAEVTITVGPDNSKIKDTLKTWVEQYNKVQSLIETQIASSTDADGKVTAGILASDSTVFRIPSDLRQIVAATSTLTELTDIKRLESIGYKSGGFDNKLSLSDETALDSALSKNLTQIEKLFSDGSQGLAVKLDSYIDSMVGDPDDPDTTGSLVNHRDAFTKQVSNIDQQIKDMEKQVQTTRQRLISNFISMEKAQAKINQQMQYLAQRFK